MTHLTHRLAGAALLAVFAVSAQAEPVTTRIGELSFDVGYPTAETAERLYDEMDFQRATQAYIWALPAVGFRALHLAHLNAFDAPNGAVVLYKDLADKAGMLTPNITTLYAFSFWDLAAQGPLVTEVPAGLTAGGVNAVALPAFLARLFGGSSRVDLWSRYERLRESVSGTMSQTASRKANAGAAPRRPPHSVGALNDPDANLATFSSIVRVLWIQPGVIQTASH
jgi:hypothetical protein